MQAAVLGKPIAHSLSPVLHRAAYEALGLDWEYRRFEVDEAGLPDFFAQLDDGWAGLSLTMPLKVAVLPLLDFVEGQAKLLRSVNTVLRSGLGGARMWVGANTDVAGVVLAFREAGITSAHRAVILGGGATATSAAAAVAELGVRHIDAFVRSRRRAAELIRAANAMGLNLQLHQFTAPNLAPTLFAADVVVSTIPAAAASEVAAQLPAAAREISAAPGALLDVIYDPLVTDLGATWQNLGGIRIGGERMLLHQAARQVQLMTGHSAPVAEMDRALVEALAAR